MKTIIAITKKGIDLTQEALVPIFKGLPEDFIITEFLVIPTKTLRVEAPALFSIGEKVQFTKFFPLTSVAISDEVIGRECKGLLPKNTELFLRVAKAAKAGILLVDFVITGFFTS